MGESVLLQTALCLPFPDIEALIQGRMIVAMPRNFINPGRKFGLYPADVLINLLPYEQHYRSSFLPIAQTALTQLGSETVLIKAWAKCELCQILDDPKSFQALSRLTIWTTEALQQTLLQRAHIFLAYLRVYCLPQPLEVSTFSRSSTTGAALTSSVRAQERHFVPLPQTLSVTDASPVLSDRLFTQRRYQLENRLPPLHPELEELQSAIAQLNNPSAQQLEYDLKKLLGWTGQTFAHSPHLKTAWINTIADLGNRSKEQDTGKSNYQAGTDFENVVRDSLEFLGFTIDYAHKGGAGGLDIFCSKPYPLVGECKAGKKIPNDTAVQLLNLGTLRLKSKEQLIKSAKLIIGPGKSTEQLEDAAKVHGMTIINPETLEKLVKLQSQYRNSVDLFKLKDCLISGQADDEVEKYIAQVEKEVRLRSHLVQIVKKYLEDTGFKTGMVHSLHGYAASSLPEKLQPQEMSEILIELSSPLTGYLGRIKGSDWESDRFYFLRDLQVD